MEPGNFVAPPTAKLPEEVKPLDPGAANVDWANHFWDEYKYRHEIWWRTFYRSIWIMGLWGTVPWVPWLREKFSHVIANPHVRLAYGVSLLFFFGLVVWFLSYQYSERMSVEYRLAVFRGDSPKEAPPKCAAFREKGVWWKSYLFVLFMVAAWLAWFDLLWYHS